MLKNNALKNVGNSDFLRTHSFRHEFEICQRKGSYPRFLSEWLHYQFKNLLKLHTSIYISVSISVIAICLKNSIAGLRNSGQYIPASIYLLCVWFSLFDKTMLIRPICSPVPWVLCFYCLSVSCIARATELTGCIRDGRSVCSGEIWNSQRNESLSQTVLSSSPPVPGWALPTLFPYGAMAASHQICHLNFILELYYFPFCIPPRNFTQGDAGRYAVERSGWVEKMFCFMKLLRKSV